MRFDLDTIPKNHGALVSPAQHFAVRQLVESGNIWKLKFAKLSDFTLKLKPSEGACHFPELDVGWAWGENDVFGVGGKACSEDFLTESFGL